MKVCLINYSDFYFKQILYNLEVTKIEYCKNHNIDYIYEEVNIDKRFKPSWIKISLIKKYIDFYDVIYITDYDSYINNIEYNILDQVSECGKDVIVNELGNLKLLGCSVWINTYKTRCLLNELIKYRDNEFLAEEGIFNNIYKKFNLDIGIDRDINLIYDIHDIHNESFMIHYAGIGNPYYIKKIDEETHNKRR